MFPSIPFAQIPGFNHLFCEFIAGNSFFSSRFPANSGNASAYFARRTSEFGGRKELLAAINATMNGLTLSEAQQHSLKALAENSSLAVVTGQQVGFLGGATYTALKLHSAVRLAENLSAQHRQFKFVPVFWVEDNDHDAAEAAEITILTSQGEPKYVSCADSNEKGIPVSARVFDEGITEIVKEIGALLPQSEYGVHLTELLEEIYAPGTGWMAAFVRLLQKLFSETGVLFLAASQVRQRGLGAEILRRETDNPERTARLIETASKELLAAGFHAQASGSAINLFYHDNSGKRLKIQSGAGGFSAGESQWTQEELGHEVEMYPERFSPNVVLRPILQDAALPTACYIGGPGEISYIAQLREVYDAFVVEMPAIAPRHSATFLTPAITRFFEKSGYRPEYFLRSWGEIDHDLSTAAHTQEFDEAISGVEAGLREAFGRLEGVASAADATLAGSVAAAQNQALKSVESIQKKAIAAMKRKNEMLFDKCRTSANLVYPSGGLQERILATAGWHAFAGIDMLHRAYRSITALPPDLHFFVPLFQ